MKIFTNIKELKGYLRPLQREGKTIGFVPTMGYLHAGHLSLMETSAKENDLTVFSIFVNPTQFGPNEDYEKYPRNEQRDLALAEQTGATIAFIPTVGEMYQNPLTTVHVAELTKGLCGASRPTHFDGVTTVVTKLFNIVAPDNAYFGQKDAQQVITLIKMVDDLNMDVKIHICPIVREADGLAMSSRNVYLSEKERKEAPTLRKALLQAQKNIQNGEKNAQKITQRIKEYITTTSGRVDYAEIVDFHSLQPLKILNGKSLIAIAVKFSNCRLIDNIIIE